MENLSTKQIREKYLKFFEEKGHLVVDSYPLVPKDDDSVLLINAGMVPLKPYFTGVKTPPNKRMATCQKCIRTGDIDNVGITKRHATFFEMLGNFSFGDYFKEEIIPWSWEFVTEVLKIDKENLFVTIYKEDDEAFDIWTKKTDMDPKKIFRLGKEDNFWEIGVGPCGPSSEIHYYKGDTPIKTAEDFVKASDDDKMTEFWNLVFTQFDKDEEGNYNPLEHPSIDTGMGLERMSTIMQGVDSIFEIDLAKDIIEEVEKITGKTYGENSEEDISIRIIADHSKGIAFLIGDGVLPSNEGRGYVLRRLIRRASRHGRVLGVKVLFLNKVIDKVIEDYKDPYQDLYERRDYIKKIVELEEKRFSETIDSGLEMLFDFLRKTEDNIFSGKNAFMLYDTYGFPVELTKEILDEKNISLDIESFKEEMEKQRERARSARKESNYSGGSLKGIDLIEDYFETEFTGYKKLNYKSRVLALSDDSSLVESLSKGEKGYLQTKKTPFYAERGGQVGDTGYIVQGDSIARVLDTQVNRNGNIIHIIEVLEGEIKLKNVELKVDKKRRRSIEKNHTATHILHKALKEVLGDHVNQAGSIVLEDRLRFDFNHMEKLSPDTIYEIEEIVNEEILKAMKVK
ncbi:MAG: alanine--tRNA ligase, partial [Clostridium sp.]|nr:alanine--tRNA ligase [Clostridium sp.]